MKLLLTDSGVRNASILAALVDLLGKPVAEASALCIPTAGYGGPYGEPVGPWLFTSGRSPDPMTELGWKSVGALELTALPGIDKERWVSWVREADALLVNGGDPLYLCHWMRESGLAGLFPSLRDTVYVGLSAGSTVLTPRTGYELAERQPPAGDDSLLGVVDFCIFPHLGLPDRPDKSMAEAERWAARIKGPGYAMDAQTAIKVTGDSIEVVSEGHWKLLNPASLTPETVSLRSKAVLAGARSAVTGSWRRPAGRLTAARSCLLQFGQVSRLLHREPFQMVMAIQQPGHCLWRVRKPLSPQVPDE